MAILKPQQAYSKIAKDYDKIYSSYKCEIENEYIRTILKNKKINEAIKLRPTLIIAACDVNREPGSAFLFKLEPI